MQSHVFSLLLMRDISTACFFCLSVRNLLCSPTNADAFMDFQHQLPTAPSWSSGPSVSIQKVIGSSILNDNAGVSFSDNHLAITAGAGSIVISIDETSLISTSDKFYCSIREDSQTKIKSATCVSLSPVKRLLAVGEIGHSPLF